jgi:predicted transcriptional regulator
MHTGKPSALEARILADLKERGWSKCNDIAKSLRLRQSGVFVVLRRLEDKKLVEVCVVGRVKRCAIAGSHPPKGGMSLEGGSRFFYHTDLKKRITRLLNDEPWLPASLIEKRLRIFGTARSVRVCLLSMVRSGRLRRILVVGPRGRLFLHALPRARHPNPERLKKVMKEASSGNSPFWNGKKATTQFLRKHPWRTARQIADGCGIRNGLIYDVLHALEAEGTIRRARVALERVGNRRPAEFVWGLKDAPLPKNMPILDGEKANGTMRSSIVLLLQELGEASAGTLATAHNLKSGRKLTFTYACKLLNELEDIGIVEKAQGEGQNNYHLVASPDDFIIKEAKAHLDALSHSVSKLKGIGYRVMVEVERKAAEEVG